MKLNEISDAVELPRGVKVIIGFHVISFLLWSFGQTGAVLAYDTVAEWGFQDPRALIDPVIVEVNRAIGLADTLVMLAGFWDDPILADSLLVQPVLLRAGRDQVPADARFGGPGASRVDARGFLGELVSGFETATLQLSALAGVRPSRNKRTRPEAEQPVICAERDDERVEFRWLMHDPVS
jgi:hypothetical protein